MSQFLIADDHPLFREALKGALTAKFDGLEVFESENFETTLQVLSEQEDLDILLLDLHMPGSGDLYGLIRIREDYPSLPIAVVSGSEDINIVSKVMSYGAMGFIPKSSSSDDIAGAINQILDGDVWLPPELKDKVASVTNEDKEIAAQVASLTPQQYKVLQYLHEGLLNKQIAYELHISEATIKAHITAIFRKLGVYNRTQAVLIAAKLQLEPIEQTH
ncbi:response regulator transcription factor [Pseudoalteromonas sp. SR44-5]|jgi:DNA-binding NarL/FixJ family response regulator|uniref:Response regulator transcription factor n=1 Tax=Pseudoalteromonas neustonica TaxID=1840331 RepID=A0ABY3FFX9_9GAMM|nr:MULTISPECIES: response regulator transcription factor [Pseudoalteromonas]MBB1293291.1 response regulator transcription factor [Pseudoalteromonas sp. SR41-4]MBB1301540.1 response regulator transcription factor [Pseudoalteromonas sp. SR44-8]MBB1308729.1 response regulator transcription factor [Pseudoalteromonas sp. SR41-8]MBB1331727.1 response regulator transcription factor [Pseudoalteromonas sp. SR41-6]MBB1341405.1 response regulator transcription factor [Pseudoalteromonas sp. SR45-6]|tara:strand:- start:12135 stop:12788 length:654 start_codon:yes stop_codon:yes gene_type:complete